MMSILTIFKSEPENEESKPQDLEQILLELKRYGTPRLVSFTPWSLSPNPGWHCYVEMNVAVNGGKMEIGSELHCKSPSEAAKQCQERVLAALKTMGGAK